MLEKLAVIFTRGKAFFKSLPEHLFLETKGLAASKKIFFA